MIHLQAPIQGNHTMKHESHAQDRLRADQSRRQDLEQTRQDKHQAAQALQQDTAFYQRLGLAGPEADTPEPSFCVRSEEHTSELQSLMRISYAVFCLKQKKNNKPHKYTIQ